MNARVRGGFSLVEAAGRDANFLLNVGPRPDGTFPDSAVTRLRALGDWLRINGASIYGTRAGPLTPRPWGVTTQRGDTAYLHLLTGVDATLAIPALPRRIAKAFLLDGGATVTVSNTTGGTTLTLPRRDQAAPDQVIVLVLTK